MAYSGRILLESPHNDAILSDSFHLRETIAACGRQTGGSGKMDA